MTMHRGPLRVLPLMALAACTGPDATMNSASVGWVEWPAEVMAATPFDVRVVMTVPCAGVERFDVAPAADASAVTLQPFVVQEGPGRTYCQGPADEPIVTALDTIVRAPALLVDYSRTFEIRATTDVYVSSASALARSPVRTFGDIVVRRDSVRDARTLAGGWVWATRRSDGCYHLRIASRWLSDGREYILENPPDTTLEWTAFIRGDLRSLPEPLCGETLVFHLVTRN